MVLEKWLFKSNSFNVPDSYGKTKQMSVQQETLDRSHPGEKHWEGGEIKEGNRSNAYGWPRLKNNKT